jgi:hypothetical protein
MQRELYVPQNDEWGWDWTRQAEPAAAGAAAQAAAGSAGATDPAAAAQLAASPPGAAGATGGAAARAAVLESVVTTGGRQGAVGATRARTLTWGLLKLTCACSQLSPRPLHPLVAGEDFVAAHQEVVRAAAAVESARG